MVMGVLISEPVIGKRGTGMADVRLFRNDPEYITDIGTNSNLHGRAAIRLDRYDESPCHFRHGSVAPSLLFWSFSPHTPPSQTAPSSRMPLHSEFPTSPKGNTIWTNL